MLSGFPVCAAQATVRAAAAGMPAAPNTDSNPEMLPAGPIAAPKAANISG